MNHLFKVINKATYSILVSVLIACTSSGDEKLIAQSKEVHEEALKLGFAVSDGIVKLKNETQYLDEPMRAAIEDSVAVLMADWEAWESSIVEVPGHDHDHHHDHDHDHDHSAAPDLTPEMVLEIQKDLKKHASNLDSRLQRILENLAEKEAL